MKKTIPASDLGKFLYYMDQFFVYLKQTFPEDTDLEYFHDKFLEFKKYNSQMIVEIFIQNMLPMEDHIMKKNEKFFLDEFDFGSLRLEGAIDLSQYEQHLYGKIKQLWTSSIPSEGKETIWKYFQILLGYGKKSVGIM